MKTKRVLIAIVLLLTSMILSSCSTPEGTYKSAQGLLAKGQYAEAADKFASLGSYEDAASLAMYCKACALCESGDYDTGIAGFEALGDYKDCAYRITYYTARSWDDGSVDTTDFELMERAKDIYAENPLYLDSTERITALDKRIAKAKKQLYNDAVAMAEKGQYDDAIDILCHIGDYEDSWMRYHYYLLRKEEDALAVSTDHDALLALAVTFGDGGDYLDCAKRAEALTNRANTIIDEKYQVAADLMKTGKYDEATTIFEQIGDYSDASTQAKESQYQKGKSLMNSGDYVAAYFTLLTIQDYSDVNTLLNRNQQFVQIHKYHSLYQEKGSIVTLGYGIYQTKPKGWSDSPAYIPPVIDLPVETINEEIDSLESYPLDWIVLSYDAENKRALLLSRYVFGDLMEFDSNDGYSWYSSSIRTWLNSEFYNNAFFEDEKATVLQTRLDSSIDYIFLLSKDEAEQYFADGIEKRGARRSSEDDDYIDWWLRSSSYKSVDQVTSYGGYYSSKYPSLSQGIRPALWVDVQSIVSVHYANYQRGISLLAEKRFDEAVQAFRNARSFVDTEDLIAESQYQKAESLFASGEFVCSAKLYSSIIDYKDSLNQAKECLYQKAMSAINAKDYETAYDALILIPGYSDADQLLNTNQGLIAARKSCFSTIGNTVRFGKYEQDGVSTNGKEDIIWIVLDYDASTKTALLISKYILDNQQFGYGKRNLGKRTSPDYPGWADSSIHKWLADNFITNAFTSEEQKQISVTSVSTPSRSSFGTTVSGGPVTQDMVFLLSKDEVNKYLNKSKYIVAAPTQYAVQQGASTNHNTIDGLGTYCWWLRNPYDSSEAYYVSDDSSISSMDVDYRGGVRPALWIKVE